MRIRHVLMLTALPILLLGCKPSSPENTGGTAKEDEFCGGIAGILCEEGLTCEYEGTYPDAGGTCKAS